MSYNIGPKIGIDGEKEFRESIRRINDTYKALQAETRAVTAAFDAQGDEQGKLEAASKQLQKQIDNQRSKMTLLEDAVKKATEQFGEESIEATRLRGALFDTQATVSKLENELKDTTSQLDNAGDAMEDLAEEAGGAGDAVLDFGGVLKANLASDVILDVLKDVGDAVKDIAVEAIDAAADIRAESAQFEQAFGDMKDSAEDSLNDIADETKVAATRMQGSYTKIFAFTKSVGADSEKALGIAGRSMRAAADNAAYFDKSIEEATEQLQAFLKGNYANDAALGIAATETTRNAKANELYAKSFQDLSEAQKVDVLLAMVEAGNEASGALGSAAREAGEWTNVNGELEESWRQFLGVVGDPILGNAIPVIQSATEWLQRMTEALTAKTDAEILAESMEKFADSIEAANKRFEETEKAIADTSYEAEYYADRLAELEDAGLDTAEAQQEYQIIVEKLNELIPDLNLTIDEQTGLLSKNTDAIKADIQAWKDSATAKALHEKFSDVLKAQGEAAAAVVTAEASLIALENERGFLLQQQADAANRLANAEKELAAATAEYYAQAESGNANAAQTRERIDAINQEMFQAQELLISLDAQLEDNSAGQKDLNAEIADAKNKLASYDDEIKLAEESIRLYGETTEKASDTADEQTVAIEKQKTAIAELEQSFAEAKSAALDSINAQIGLFDELALESDWSAERIIKNWQDQQAAFARYNDNLQKAVDMGLDEALVQQLSDGSAQSMQILDALVNDTEISIDEINAAFAGVSESKDVLASTMGEMQTDFSTKMAELEETARQSGKNIIDGLIAGVESRQPAFGSATANVGKSGLQAFNEQMEIRSPARKMIPSGEFTVDGAIEGVENREKAFREAMSDLALAGENSFLSAQLQRVGEYPSMVQAPTSYSRSVAHNYGGINISIHQQPGESGEDLAYRVMEIIQHEVEVKEAGFGA